MNRRTIPFGYKFENGAVVVEDSAADIVKEIFNRYLAGDSMLNISELLNKLHVEYTPGITGWNKARIKRILENKKYLGNEDFPPIIDEDIALRADEMREVRNKQKNVNKEELIYNLTAETICPCCGTAMKRRFDPRTKIHGRWRCQRSDCRKLVAITDEVMLTEITELLEHLSKHPENILLPPEEGSINLESLRIENEINRMLDSRQINKEELRTKMLESASLSYSGLNNKIYITQRLTNMFENYCPTGYFPMELFDQSVSEISFDEKDNVTITLINGQLLRKEHAYAAS